LRRQPSLRAQLNQIRLWVRQGRTDAWIAHKLDVSIDQLERFKRDHGLDEGGAAPARPADPLSVPPPEPEPEREEEEPEEPEAADEPEVEETAYPQPAPRAAAGRRRQPQQEAREREREDGDDAPAGARRGRRRGRRGGRRRRGRAKSYEATFDHGEDGYGLWLDPAVVDNPVYAEHWAGRRAIVVTLERDAITIRRAGEEEPPPDGEAEPDE
jgi:hypothetical protein